MNAFPCWSSFREWLCSPPSPSWQPSATLPASPMQKSWWGMPGWAPVSMTVARAIIPAGSRKRAGETYAVPWSMLPTMRSSTIHTGKRSSNGWNRTWAVPRPSWRSPASSWWQSGMCSARKPPIALQIRLTWPDHSLHMPIGSA